MGDGYNYPGYNYLGPGNSVNTGAEVVNSTDFIAYVHDLKYTLAERSEDIHEADRVAISEFIKDFEKNHRVADLVGAIGLGLKYGVESVFGVKYPSMSSLDKYKSFSDFISAQRDIHLSHEYERVKHEYSGLSDFKNRSDTAKRLYENYRKDGYYYKQYRSEWNARRAVKNQAPLNEQQLSTSGANKRPAPDSGDDNARAAKSLREDYTESPEGSDTGSLDSNQIVKESADTANFDSLVVNTSSGEQEMDTTPISESPVVQSGSGRGPNTGARSGASGNGGSECDRLTWIRPSKPSPNSRATFKKTRILISYGYSTENIQLNDPDYTENITTSLGLIPVDYLPFYLTESEFESLPLGAKIVKVECTVTPLGTRTAFDTGSVLSGTATSEYVPIGLVCEGMNVQFYGRNRTYKVVGTNPMKPTAVESISARRIAKSYYENVKSNALCVPQDISEYFCHEWNRPANPDINKLPNYMIHNCGVARMDEKVHQFLINQAVGKQIYHYTYQPKFGLIKSTKEHFVPWSRRGNKMETSYSRPHSMALKFFETADGKTAIGDVGLGITTDNKVLINQVVENYYRKIENYGAFFPSRGPTNFNAQPQLHVGLAATPQLNPAIAAHTFLNSCCYWKIEASCTITFNLNSAFSKYSAISWPLEVSFMPNEAQQYTDGQTLFGQTDTGSGNISREIDTGDDDVSEMEADDDYDLLE